MRSAGAGLAAFLAFAAPAAFAQTAFVVLPGTSESSITFWDMGGLKRSGTTIEIKVLTAYAQVTTSDTPIKGSLETVRLSCDWNTLIYLGSADVDAAGQVSNATSGDSEQPRFFGPGGWHAKVTPVACDFSAALPAANFTSIPAAMAEAVRVTKRPAPEAQSSTVQMVMVAPVRGRIDELAHFSPPKPSRYGVLRTEADTGNTLFVDWGNMIRDGNNIDLLTFEVLGDDLPKGDRTRLDVMRVSSVNLHCRDRIITVLEYVPMDRNLATTGSKQYQWFPRRRPSNWKLGGELLDAACAGREPAETFATRDAAIAFQRKLHPLKQ